MNAIPETCHAY